MTQTWEKLIVATLAVGGFSLDRVRVLESGLRDRGLLDPENLATWGPERVTRQLYEAGYRRGLLTGMYAERLVAIGEFAAAGPAGDQRMQILAGGDEKTVGALLNPVFGVGPKVVANFLVLRGKGSDQSR